MTWVAGSRYVVVFPVVIPSGVTLTIEPGVIVEAGPTTDTLFHFPVGDGKLYAQGTVENPIIFDGKASDGTLFAVSPCPSSLGNVVALILDHCRVIGGERFLWIAQRRARVTNTYFAGQISRSIVNYPTYDFHIEHNIFDHTAGLDVSPGIHGIIYIHHNLFVGKGPDLSEDFNVHNRGPSGGWLSLNSPSVMYNSFVGGDGVALRLECDYPNNSIMYATENYWGTLDTDIIDSMIYDRNDSLDCFNYIEYLPILTEPHPDTPSQ